MALSVVNFKPRLFAMACLVLVGGLLATDLLFQDQEDILACCLSFLKRVVFQLVESYNVVIDYQEKPYEPITVLFT